MPMPMEAMEDNRVLTPERQKGLLIGSLLSAAINASTGSNSREALAKAAIGGMKAYTGGINSIYDIEKSNLDIQRQKDLISAAKQSRSWAEEDRPGQVLRNDLAAKTAQKKFGWLEEDRPGQVLINDLAAKTAQKKFGWLDEEHNAIMQGRNKANEAADILNQKRNYELDMDKSTYNSMYKAALGQGYNEQQAKAIAGSGPSGLTYSAGAKSKYIPPKPIGVGNDLLWKTAVNAVNNELMLSGADLSTIDKNALDQEIISRYQALESKVGKNAGAAQNPSPQSVTQLPPGVPEGSIFKGLNPGNGGERWLTPDGKKITVLK